MNRVCNHIRTGNEVPSILLSRRKEMNRTLSICAATGSSPFNPPLQEEGNESLNGPPTRRGSMTFNPPLQEEGNESLQRRSNLGTVRSLQSSSPGGRK